MKMKTQDQAFLKKEESKNDYKNIDDLFLEGYKTINIEKNFSSRNIKKEQQLPS